MRRREFITLIGGLAAWPLAAGAQQPDGMRRIGVLSNRDEHEGQADLAAFRERLHDLGWSDGRNVLIEAYFTGRDRSRLVAEAAELLGHEASVIVTSSTIATQAVQKQTSTVPIVFASASDPVASGLVASLAHPGGNVTGFSNVEFSFGAKWLELLKQVAPSVNRVLVMLQPDNDGNRGLRRAIQRTASAFSVELTTVDENDAIALQGAVETLSSKPDGGVIVLPNPTGTRSLILALAIQHRLPAIFELPEFARAGGLLSYGLDRRQSWWDAAGYVDRILKGEKPANLPVQQPTKFTLVINLKTAKALGLTVPPALLARADEVIE
jgi:putative tryptophan/tyrosine transport system substrate-binding protein